MESRIENFRLIREIGRGGMGTVYEAIDETLNRRVALKVIRGRADGDDETPLASIDALLQEARVIAQLAHPSLVTIYGFGRQADGAWIAMELLEGETLAQRLQRDRAFDAQEAIDLICRVARATGAVHDVGVVHRDLKPGNVMLLRRGDVKILDFGVAVRVGGNDGVLAGTPGYSAPEQYRTNDVTPASDVYSLAAMAVELLVGKRPFDGEDAAGLAALSQSGPPPELQRAQGLLSDAHLGVLRASLDPDPALRPSDASAFADLLEGGSSNAVAAEQPRHGGAKPHVRGDHVGSRRRRSRVVFVSVLLGTLTLAAGAGAFSLGPSRSYRPRVAAEGGLQQAAPEPTARAVATDSAVPTTAHAEQVPSVSGESSREETIAADTARSGRVVSTATAALESVAQTRAESAASVGDLVVAAQPPVPTTATLRIREGSCRGFIAWVDELDAGDLPVAAVEVPTGRHLIRIVNGTGDVRWRMPINVTQKEVVITPACGAPTDTTKH